VAWQLSVSGLAAWYACLPDCSACWKAFLFSTRSHTTPCRPTLCHTHSRPLPPPAISTPGRPLCSLTTRCHPRLQATPSWSRVRWSAASPAPLCASAPSSSPSPGACLPAILCGVPPHCMPLGHPVQLQSQFQHHPVCWVWLTVNDACWAQRPDHFPDLSLCTALTMHTPTLYSCACSLQGCR